MPNRIIKETICSSDSIDGLSWFEECFFVRLIVNCDDFGCFDARPAILKARLFPLRSVTDKQVTDALNKLSTVGIVYLYEVDGKPYLQFVTWESHQQVRAKRSKYPPFQDSCNQVQSSDINCNQMISSDIKCNQVQSSDINCSPNPIQSNPNPYPKLNPNPNPNPNAREVSSSNEEAGKLIDNLIESYPSHRLGDKYIVEREIAKMSPDKPLLTKMQSALDEWKRSEQWVKEGGQYIPKMENWITKGTWKQKPPPDRKRDTEQKQNFAPVKYDDEKLEGLANSTDDFIEMMLGDKK